MIVPARLDAIARIRIVAFGISHVGGIVATKRAIGFATVTTHVVAVIALFGSLHNAIPAFFSRGAPRAGGCNRDITSASRSHRRRRKSGDRQLSHNPKRIYIFTHVVPLEQRLRIERKRVVTLVRRRKDEGGFVPSSKISHWTIKRLAERVVFRMQVPDATSSIFLTDHPSLLRMCAHKNSRICRIACVTRVPPMAVASVLWPGKTESPTIHTPGTTGCGQADR